MLTYKFVPEELKEEIINFAQELVRVKSFSGYEENVIKLIESKMRELAYDKVKIDKMGNVVGYIGNGEKVLMFDSHVDTVLVTDEEEWVIDPFKGEIIDGRLYGRGSVDMKSSIAASIYAGSLAKRRGELGNKQIVVSCTVFEEDCEGENLKHLFKEFKLKPNFMVICEPSNNMITIGHKGKAQIVITTYGVSSHGSAPDKGVNAIYEMADIIKKIEKINDKLNKKKGEKGTLVLSKISSNSASLNAVPSKCEIYLDRRLVIGEDMLTIEAEMDEALKNKNASWTLGTLHRTSWKGMNIIYEPYHKAWKIDMNHELMITAIESFKSVFGREAQNFNFWDFSTNAVTPIAMGIPCIGFGPGNYKLAHMKNENCETKQIIDACNFYIALMINI